MRKEGGRGEQIAMQYLLNKGYRLLQSNYTAPCGEIDLIVYNDQYIVFTEVRMRASRDFGHPLETVTAAKQKKIRKTAQHFLLKNQRSTLQPRIDVIAIDAPGGGFEAVEIEHIENAF
ncbi:MAG: YraN family protein [Oscillospiraceae bacterium]|jgi:putative endonuclease|nr:YraN family protein [Oscillospiraceae bacterium]